MANVEALNQLKLKVSPHLLTETEAGHFVAKNPLHKTYLQLGGDEKALLQMLDGERTVGDILQVYYETKGSLPFKTLYNLIAALHLKHFFADEPSELLDELVGGDARKKNRWMVFISGIFVNIPPLQILKYLSPLFIIFCNPFVQGAILVDFLVFLFTASPVHHVNVFQVSGSYVNGILLAYGSLIALLSLRAVFRAAAVWAAGCDVNAIGIRILPGLIYLDANTDDIVMAGRKQTARMQLSGLMSPLLGASSYGIASVFMPSPPGAALLVQFMAVLLLFIQASPHFRSDLVCLLDALFKIPQLDRHAQSYLRKKFFSRIFSKESVVEKNEKFLIVLSTFGFMWLYGGFLMFTSSVADQAYFLVRDFKPASHTDKIAMGFLAANLIFPILVFISFFTVMLATNIYHSLSNIIRRSRLQNKRRLGSAEFSQDEALSLFAQNPIFAQHTLEEQKELAGLVKSSTYKPGETVIVQGEPGDAFYVILEGTVEVVHEELSGVEKHLDFLTDGDSFGEIALLEHVTRTATVRAVKPTRVLRLEKEPFERFVADSEEKRKRLTDWIRFYSKLHKSPLFHEMSPGQMLQIMEKVSKQPAHQGDVIIHQGETGDKFYIIASGQFQVSHQKNGAEEIITSLGEGDYFGDVALLKGVKRTATVRALTDGVLFTLTSGDFLDVVRRNLQFGLLLENVAEARLAKAGNRKN